MANFHARYNLWLQALVLCVFAGIVLICSAAFIGVFESTFNAFFVVVIPGDAVWLLIVSLLSLGVNGYFLFSQGAAKNVEYVPTMLFLVAGVIFTILWFTAAVALAASSLSYCAYAASLGSAYAYLGSVAPSTAGICATGGLADAFAWLSFIGSLCFTLTVYGVGSKVGAWASAGQNFQMGAVPQQQQQFQQQPYPQQPYQQQPPFQQPQQPPYTAQSPYQQPQQLYGEVKV